MPPQRLARKLLLSTAVFILTVVILELANRVRLHGLAGLSYARYDSVKPIGQSGMLRPSPIPELRFTLRPNLDTWYKLVPFETNSVGLRDREYPLEPPANTYRVAVVGDSFTMGSGVRQEHLFHSLLEDRLNQNPQGPAYEFINFGVAGYDLHHYLHLVREVVPSYHPDLILVCVTQTDTQVHRADRRLKPYRPVPERHPFFSLSILDGLRAPPAQKPTGPAANEPQATGEPAAPRPQPPTRAPEPPEPREYILESVRGLALAAREQEVPLALVFLASQRREQEAFQAIRWFREAARLQQVPFRDTSSAFDGVLPGELQIYAGDDTPTPPPT